MRLIHNMTTIAECPAPENSPLGRVIKMAVIGGSGVGKTGKTKKQKQKKTAVVEGFSLRARVCSWKFVPFFLAALVVRFLTRRFIGDYERNAGKSPNNLIKYDELKEKDKNTDHGGRC